MTHSTVSRAGFVLGLLLGLMVSAATQAQQVSEGVQTGQGAYYLRAEEQRRAQIDSQRQLAEQMRSHYTWPDPHYAPTVADVYRSGYIYGPRRMYRQAVRFGLPPVVVAGPRAPTDFFGHPMYGPVRAPIGQEKVGAGASGYNFPPVYGQPPQAPGQSLPPQSGTPTPALLPVLGSPDVAFPSEPAPEPIPVPPSEPGPREF